MHEPYFVRLFWHVILARDMLSYHDHDQWSECVFVDNVEHTFWSSSSPCNAWQHYPCFVPLRTNFLFLQGNAMVALPWKPLMKPHNLDAQHHCCPQSYQTMKQIGSMELALLGNKEWDHFCIQNWTYQNHQTVLCCMQAACFSSFLMKMPDKTQQIDGTLNLQESISSLSDKRDVNKSTYAWPFCTRLY